MTGKEATDTIWNIWNSDCIYLEGKKSHHRCDQRLTQIVQRGCEISNLKVVKNLTGEDPEQSPLSTRGPPVILSNINYSVTTLTSERERVDDRGSFEGLDGKLWESVSREIGSGEIANYRIIEQPRLEETSKDHLSDILWEKKPG